MSLISTNLMRIHYAKSVADMIHKASDHLVLRKLTRDLSNACVEAHNLIYWPGVNINLRTIDRQIKAYSAQAYGNPLSSRVDGLRLVGMAIVQIEDAMNGQRDDRKRYALQRCLDAAMEINRFFDEDLVENEKYLDAANDAKVFESVVG